MNQAASALRPLKIENRKYIGCKQNLLPFITGVIATECSGGGVLADLFAGSGVVSHHFVQRGWRVVAAENLLHNHVILRAFLTSHRGNADREAVAGALVYLNALPPLEGFAFRSYGSTYFTPENAARIDGVREGIAYLARRREVNSQEEALLLTSLLYAADKVANTCGQYDAYLKHLGNEPYDQDGTHQVDAMVYRALELCLPAYPEGAGNRALLGDANALVRQVPCDVLYLDPPYNTRQYVDNYHVLECIARWDQPPLYGKTMKFRRDPWKSAYSRRHRAAGALADLVERAACRHIFLSYNNEGIISDAQLHAILGRRGPVAVYHQQYSVFGNGAGRSRRRTVVERLFHCRVAQ